MNEKNNMFPSLKNIVNIPKELIDLGNISSYIKNYEIIKVGEIIDKIFFIMEGKVKLINRDTRGNEFIVQYFLEGTTFGEGFIFNDIKKPSLFSIVTIENCKICSIPSTEILAYSMQHPELLIDIINVLHNKMCLLNEQMDNIVFNKPNERIAFIMYTIATFSVNNTAYLPLKMTHQELANLTGCTRVTVTRTLNALKNEGILDYKKGQLVINNLDRLKEFSKF